MMADCQAEIKQNRRTILSIMQAAAKRAGRKDQPRLIAVSKQQPDERIAAMLAAGQKSFGENRVQEAQTRWGDRFAGYRPYIELRLIGPLQSNKALDAVRLFDVIETLDRDSLARALAKAADKAGIMPRLYIQINTGEEPQKSGLAPSQLSKFLNHIAKDYDLHPEGLMCIPPAREPAAPHFWLLNNLAKDHGLKNLSMGMSADYETAIEMGASSVRIGSALFGDRP